MSSMKNAYPVFYKDEKGQMILDSIWTSASKQNERTWELQRDGYDTCYPIIEMNVPHLNYHFNMWSKGRTRA